MVVRREAPVTAAGAPAEREAARTSTAMVEPCHARSALV